MGRNVGRGKVAYSWISPEPAKAVPTLEGGGGGGVVFEILSLVRSFVGSFNLIHSIAETRVDSCGGLVMK